VCLYTVSPGSSAGNSVSTVGVGSSGHPLSSVLGSSRTSLGGVRIGSVGAIRTSGASDRSPGGTRAARRLGLSFIASLTGGVRRRSSLRSSSSLRALRPVLPPPPLAGVVETVGVPRSGCSASSPAGCVAPVDAAPVVAVAADASPAVVAAAAVAAAVAAASPAEAAAAGIVAAAEAVAVAVAVAVCIAVGSVARAASRSCCSTRFSVARARAMPAAPSGWKWDDACWWLGPEGCAPGAEDSGRGGESNRRVRESSP
jgi:hypothetical protein